MAGHDLIAAYLAELRRRLPSDAVDELTDGLSETFHRHLGADADPERAARRAIAEFGAPDVVVAAFTRQAPGRRTALRLLATGPLVGLCWGAGLASGHAWTWPVPVPLRLVLGTGLLLAVACLATAATGRRYARTRLAAVGGVTLLALDGTLVMAVLLAAPTRPWPLALAIPASLARMGLTLRALPPILTR